MINKSKTATKETNLQWCAGQEGKIQGNSGRAIGDEPQHPSGQSKGSWEGEISNATGGYDCHHYL